jgi:hypothetical protein
VTNNSSKATKATGNHYSTKLTHNCDQLQKSQKIKMHLPVPPSRQSVKPQVKGKNSSNAHD